MCDVLLVRMVKVQLLFVFVLTLMILRGKTSNSDSLIKCRDGWVTHSKACYKFETVVYPWQDASSLCVSQLGQLLVIQGDEELQWLKSQVGKVNDRSHWWIGMKGLDSSGRWLQQAVTTNYIVPFNNEPDNSHGDMNCVSISNRGFLRTQACAQKQRFICKLPKPTPKTDCNSVERIASGVLIETSNNCYWFVVFDTNSWNDARAQCMTFILTGKVNVTADLLSIQERPEWITLRQYMISYKSFTGGWWTGLRYQAQSKQYTFSDKTPFSTAAVPWMTQEALGDDISDNCGALLKNGKAMAYSCEKNLAYICKHSRIRQEVKCPDFWHRAGESCYYVSQERNVNWTSAVSKCKSKSKGAHLLKTDSYTEKEWLEITVALQFPRYWTGLNARAAKGVYVWEDESRFNNSLLRWDKGSSAWRHCGILTATSLYYSRCESFVSFLACEYNLPGGATSCADGWILNRNKCYYFAESKMHTWFDVKPECYKVLENKKPNYGVTIHYITIENLMELNFIHKKVGNSKIWLGLNDLNDMKTWIWEDAPKVSTSILSPINTITEPDPYYRCVTITKGGIYKSGLCSSEHAYICELNAKLWKSNNSQVTKHIGNMPTLFLSFSLVLVGFY